MVCPPRHVRFTCCLRTSFLNRAMTTHAPVHVDKKFHNIQTSSSSQRTVFTMTTDPSPGMVVPFFLFLICIAAMPFIHKEHWENHYHHFSFLLATIVFIYYCAAFQGEGALRMFLSLLDYYSFLCLVGSLYIIAGGIHIDMYSRGTPLINVSILAVGALIANFIGTTGASMLLIRPFVRINKSRIMGYHVILFIFIVSNCGGVLTPLGDPPLFLGYLKGVPFFWLLTQPRVIGAWLFVVGSLLIIFYFIDRHFYNKHTQKGVNASFTSIRADDISAAEEGDEFEEETLDKDGKRVQIDDNDVEGEDDKMLVPTKPGSSSGASQEKPLHILGHKNVAFLAVIVVLVLIQKADFMQNLESTQAAQSGFGFLISTFMAATGVCAWYYGDKAALEANSFTFGPVKEVGYLFFGIFTTMVPALDLLQNHAKDLHMTSPRAFYWASGALSSVLDNAPTYLNFLSAAFGLRGKSIDSMDDTDALLKDDQFVKFIVAISLGSVFFGANTYIGNGPNFMVKALAEEGGAKCPSFFEYIYKYSMPLLMPLFLIVSYMCVQDV